MIVTSDLMESIDSNKILPIIRQKGTSEVPTFLKTKLYIDMSSDELEEFGLDELIRTVHKSPLYKKPDVGQNPFESGNMPELKQPKPALDSLLEFMRSLVKEFNQTSTRYVLYKDLVKSSTLSRIMMDFEIDKALNKGLIIKDNDGDLIMTEKGRLYAVENGFA